MIPVSRTPQALSKFICEPRFDRRTFQAQTTPLVAPHLDMASQAKIIDGTSIAKYVLLFVSYDGAGDD